MKQYLEAILFPQTCTVCGSATFAERMLCDYCIEHVFEPANPDARPSCPGHIPPEYVEVQDALWKYDKKGHLQNLLMKLKYQGQRNIGFQCGRLMGRKWRYSPWYDTRISWMIVPVPLHWLKYWKRGYNQAEVIARGFSQETGVPIAGSEVLRRQRYTRTQTGFTMEDRHNNIRGAFAVHHPETIAHHKIIIIDDVFTTGATTYQLADLIHTAEVNGVHIYTIAVA